MAGGGEGGGSLEETPTWAVSIFALFFFILTFLIDTALHHLTKFLRRRKRKSLNKAVEKFKSEMMKLGFVSLLLAIAESPISKICVSSEVANSFLPCNHPPETTVSESEANQVLDSTFFNSISSSTHSITADGYCDSKGMVSLVSRDAIVQLNIFIAVLAVFHVLYCILTMFLGMAKMRKWNAWEKETRTLEYQIANDPRRFQHSHQTAVAKRHLKFWSKHPLFLWPTCLVRQFTGSVVSKVDYLTLRNGFIKANFAEGNNFSFNFQKFLARAYDDDFEQVVGIRFWIWFFCILFIFFSAHVFYSHYWLSFIPLAIVVLVGAKLEVIITKLCVDNIKQNPVIRGSFTVKPKDDLFWFGRPHWLLHLIQFVLIQNSFQLAFFTWTLFAFGQKSCFHRRTEDIVISITMGIAVQLLCGYVTLPLYALVTQMGSGMKTAVFTETVVKGLKNWRRNAKRSISKSSKSTSRQCSGSEFSISDSDHEQSIPGFTDTVVKSLMNWYKNATNESPSKSNESTSSTIHYKDTINNDYLVSDSENTYSSSPKQIKRPNLKSVFNDISTTTEAPTSSEFKKGVCTAEVEEVSTGSRLSNTEASNKIEEGNSSKGIARVTYDGEISFGSSWKQWEGSKGSGEISSIVEEDASDILPNFNEPDINIM